MDADPYLCGLFLILYFILYLYYTVAEASFAAFSDQKMEKLAEDGNKKAKRVIALCESEKNYKPALLVGRLFFALSFSALWAVCLHTLFSRETLALPWLFLSLIGALIAGFILWLFCELFARRLAVKAPEQTAVKTVGAVSFLAGLLFPFLWLCQLLNKGLLRLCGVNPDSEASEVTEEEILNMVDIGEEAGAIESTEKEMIENVFAFNNTTAEDVMIHRTNIDALWIEDDTDTILKVIDETGHSRFPVYGENLDDILGILNAKRFLLNLRTKAPLSLKELITPPFFVPELVKADALFREMQAKKNHIAIVVDEYGGTSGLVTMEDLIEEIVGNIYDEFDEQPEQEIVPLGQNLWRISGQTSMEDVAEALNIKIPEDEDYETLGGLVFSGLTTIPQDGEKPVVEALGLHIEVTEIADRHVTWANVSLIKPPEEPDAEKES